VKSTEGPDAAGQPAALVWDLPIRLFHWSLVALFALSWWSAEYHYDTVHLWSGYALLAGLLFRLLWGFAGSSTARFSSFVRGPGAVVGYLRGGWRRPHVGHSPLGALSVVAMLALLLSQVVLGLFATDEDGEMYGPLAALISVDASDRALELHETNFDLLKIVVGLHIAAIAFYWLVLKKALVRPMLSGRASLDPGTEPMRPAARGRAMACLVAALAITAWIVAGAPPLGT
jgi:cytochrome b